MDDCTYTRSTRAGLLHAPVRPDAQRNSTARKRTEPGRPGRSRIRSLAARSLTVVLLVAFAAFLAPPVQAQTEVTLVSNFSSPGTTLFAVGDISAASTFIQAQKFTTGANADGYTLTSVTFNVGAYEGANITPRVSVYTEATDGNPGSSLYGFTGTITGGGATTFTAPSNATLVAETSYFVVLEDTNSITPSHHYRVQLAVDADDDVAEMGWSLDERYQQRNAESWTSSATQIVGLEIKGTVNGGTTSTDATLSALAVNDGTNDLTLDPAFAPGTYIYAADVANAVDAVTLTATVNDGGAEVSGVTLGGTAIADADFSDGITVPSLVVDANEIIVTVTAEDDATTLTYTVTVTRAMAVGAQTSHPTVTGLTVSPGASPGELSISWDPHPDGPDDYRVKWAAVGDDYRRHTNLNWNAYPTGTQHTVSGLEPGASHKVQVRARFNEGTNSPWSSEVIGQSADESENQSGQPRESPRGNSSTIKADRPLSAPADFTFEPGDGQFVLSWAAVTADPAVSSYELRHREVGTVNWTETSAGNSLTTTLTGLTNYTTYEVMVAAKNSEGIGPYAGIAEAIPGPVSIVRAMRTGDGWAVKLTFNTPLDTAVTPTASHFSVRVATRVGSVTTRKTEAPARVVHTFGDSRSVTLVLATRMGGDPDKVAATVDYGDPDGDDAAGVVQDASGKDALGFTDLVVEFPADQNLVGNGIERPDSSTIPRIYNRGQNDFRKVGQGFTTGPKASGYLIFRVSVHLVFAEMTETTFGGTIHLANADGTPGAVVHELESVTYGSSRVYNFEAPPGVILEPATTYVMVVRQLSEIADDDTDRRAGWNLTSGTGESGEAGWSIADQHLLISPPESGGTTFATHVGDIAIDGEDAVRALVPGTPGNVMLAGGDHQLVVSWTAPTDGALATSYDLRYRLSTETDWTLKTRGADTSLTDTLTELHNGRSFQVEVRAVSGDYNGAWSATASGSTTGTVSTDASLTALSLSDVTLSPQFGSTTYSYTGAAENLTASTTVTTSTNSIYEKVEFFLGSATESLDDAYLDEDGHQVMLRTGENTLSIKVTAEDGDTVNTYTIAITRAIANAAPTFTSGLPTVVSVAENTAANINIGSAFTATDGDNDTITYSLSDTTASSGDAANFTITTSGQIRTKEAIDFEDQASYAVTINVTDGKDAVDNPEQTPTTDASHAVMINVTDVEEAGTVTVAGATRGGSSLTTLVSDPDGSVSDIRWRWARSDTATGAFTDITINGTASSYRLVAADVGTYLQITASYSDRRGSGKSASAVTAQITTNNAEPAFSAMTATRTLPENSAPETAVGAPVSAMDSDTNDMRNPRDTLTYSLSGTDAGSFTFDSTTGQIKTRAGVTYNFEATKNSYSVTVNVRDSKDAAGNPDIAIDDSVDVTISLTNVNEAPTIPATNPTTANFAEITATTTAVATFTASDVDASTTFTWSVESADDGGKFDINPSTGALTFKTSPNFEMPVQAGGTDNLYNVTVKVTDNGSPARSATHSIAITVTNVNEPPTIASGPSSLSTDENTPTTELIATYVASDVDGDDNPGNLRWTLEGVDAGDFILAKNAMTNAAELKFRNVPNYEMPADFFEAPDTEGNNVYDVTVKVADDGGVSDTRDVEITVNDLNETPVISGDATPDFAEIEFDVPESDLTAADYVVRTYTATDDDNTDDAGLNVITWYVNGTDADHFTIDANTGELSFKARSADNSIDFENPDDNVSNNEYEIVIEADDGQGETNSVGTFAVTVTVTPINETPEITTTATTHATPMFDEIEHDATTADLTVADYAARDMEGETITWSLGGDDMSDFMINTSSGVLSFASRPNYEMPADADRDNAYEIIVKARDTNSNTRDYPVVVTVTDQDETPEFTNPPADRPFAEIEHDAPGMPDLQVATFTARDEEDEDLRWSLEGADANDFVITENSDGEGVVSFASAPNFEMPEGSGATSDIYEFRVVVNDEADLISNGRGWDYVVTLTDVNERPEFIGQIPTSTAYDENGIGDVADYNARDEEGIVDWSLDGTDQNDFKISTDGTVSFVDIPSYEDPQDGDGNNVYQFTVVATDRESGPTRRSVMQVVTVTVRDIEEPGVISVSNFDPSVGQGIRFELTDPDGGIQLDSSLDIDWRIQVREPGLSWDTLSVVDQTATSITYIADEDFTGQQVRATVTYIDGRGGNKTAQSEPTNPITADPSPNVQPRFRPDDIGAMAEGPAGTVVGMLTATDRDNDTLTFGIEERQDSGFFAVNPSTGQITLAQALDFEALPDNSGQGPLLFFTATLSDGKAVDETGTEINDDSVDVTSTISVFVTDIEEAGVVRLSDPEPGVGTTVEATLADGDGGASGQSWTWARSVNGRTNWINISGATASSYTTTETDADFFLRATVSYTDRRGGGKSAAAITTQRAAGDNLRPTFPTSESGQRTIPENTSSRINIGLPVAAEDPERDRLTYSLSGIDAAAFTIDSSTGQLRTLEDLDFEGQSSYTVTVEVHDGKGALDSASTTVDATQAVTITIENVEEPGTVTLTTLSQNIQARVAVTAVLDDDDNPPNVSWQWSRSANGRTLWVNIAGATSATYTPTLEEDRGHYIRAKASYSDGHGPDKTAQAVSPRVGDPPPVNSAPAFPASENGQREAPEGAAVGDPIGEPVAATDVNAGDSSVNDPIAYSLSGTDAASFEIDPGSGQIRLASGVQLDYERKRTYRLTVRVTDGRDQTGDDDMDAIDDTINVTITVTDVNEAPGLSGDNAPSYQENSNSAVATYSASDPERDTITWTVDNDIDFWISQRGQLYFRNPPSYEDRTNYQVTVVATDEDGLSDSIAVTVTVTDAEEAGSVAMSPPRGWVDQQTLFSAVLTDDDGQIVGTTWQWARSTDRSRWLDIAGATQPTYTVGQGNVDEYNHYLRATASYSDRRGSNKMASGALPGRIGDLVPATNRAPEFAEASAERSIGQGTAAGRAIGAPVRAVDPDVEDILSYSLSGPDADDYWIDPSTGQLRTKAVLDFDSAGTNSYDVTVSVHDGFAANYAPSTNPDDSIDVTITVLEASPAVSGGGGGGGPSGPTPSTVDFEWTVTHDIEELDAGHDKPSGMWSDGATLWLAHNGDGADDAVYAYDLESGERVGEREFELDEANRAPRGLWSDGATMWVSDSGQDKLFAHDLKSGERLPDSDLALHPDNDDPRGIWADGSTMWVLDGRDNALFAYDLVSGTLLAEYALHDDNGDPRGIFFDGVTVWVSDDVAKRLFAYRLPALEEEDTSADEDVADEEEDLELERVTDEEFTKLSGASNNSPRGLWSDGDVMYVADASDGKVYTYNMPDAIDARLASLTLSGVDFGEFDSAQAEYAGTAGDDVTETLVGAEAVQSGAAVVIKPDDDDGDPENGHQVALEEVPAITVTVTSRDESRERVYRVLVGDPDQEAPSAPAPPCFRGAVALGFSLVVYAGGSVEELVTCAQSRHGTALYTLHDGGYVPYILGAPEFVNSSFGELFADGVPASTPLIVKSDGPPTADPAGSITGDDRTPPWPECLRGTVATGFSLVLYQGGAIEELVTCAESRDITAIYALDEGGYVPYILGAPDFVNRAFRALFTGGVPATAPLIVKSDGVSAAGATAGAP